MISKNLVATNPLLYNITLKISKTLSEQWLEAMRNDYLPKCTDGKIIVASQINEVLVDSEDGDNTYAVQFVFASKTIFDRDGLPALGQFLKLLDADFLRKYVYFTTKMEIIHELTVPSEN